MTGKSWTLAVLKAFFTLDRHGLDRRMGIILDSENGTKSIAREVKSSPVVLNHGCGESKFWPIERCLTGLDLTETSLMVESWYGWALGQCGYVVYGPDPHRTYKRFARCTKTFEVFSGRDPFW